MAYKSGEDLIVALIKTHANFSDSNVSQATWGLLNSGNSDHYAITKSGGMTPEFITPTIYVAHQNTIVEVWQQYTDDGTSATNLYGEVENLRSTIQSAPLLSDTNGIIQNSEIASIDEVQEMWTSGGGPAWLRQNITVAWEEQVST